MGTATRLWSHDTYVNATYPKRNYQGAPRLGLRKWDASNAQYAFISFTKPFVNGVKVTEATLVFHTYSMPETGSHSLHITRVTEKSSYTSMTYDNRPDVHMASQINVTKSGVLEGGYRWEVDVKDHLQAVADGAPWYGWRITTGDTQQRWIYAHEETSVGAEGPKLTVKWADNPDEPESLSPSEGVVGTAKPAITFEYIDVAGDTTLTAAQIQTSTTTSFAAPTWDSGVYEPAVLRETIYLSGTTYPGATAGKRVYWRIRVMDGAGLWSKWSTAAWFIYKPPTGITMISPRPDDLRFADSSPQISWSSPDMKAYQITIALNTNPSKYLWNTGKVKADGDLMTVEVPKGKLRWDDRNYRLIIRAWDSERRVSAANSLAYQTVSGIVHLDKDDAMEPVAWTKVAQDGKTPYVTLEWTRAVAADEYEIVREQHDEKIIVDRITHEEALVSSGRYRYKDRTAAPRTPVRYIVRPVTNGKRAGGTPTEWIETYVEGVWLTNYGWGICISGVNQGTWELPENSTAHQVMGARAPVVIREVYSGYQGSIEGTLIEEELYQPHLTLHDKRDRFLWMKAHTPDLQEFRLVAGDLNIPVHISNLNAFPTPDAAMRYEISFDFWQYDEIWWDHVD